MTYYLIYAITLGIAAIYSYVLLDPNITFLNHPLWTSFRDAAVQIGYHQRPLSTYIYFGVLAALAGLHIWSIKHEKKINPVKTAILIGGILTFSYPFLSHDFFNYMFDAKILTYYHQNPYFHAGLDYPDDTWLRFMHWVHRPYPYGPTFLAISSIPSFLGFGKFLIHFFLLKALFTLCYIASVYFVSKFDRKYGVFMATQPLILVEGLISSHNEMVALGLGVMGLYFMAEKRGVLSTILLICSAGVKFMSFPFMLVERWKYRWLNYISLAAMIFVLAYATFRVVIQPWYFINLFFYLPIFPNLIPRLQIFFFGLLASYYPYIMLGGWDSDQKVAMKNWIIAAAFALNVLYLLVEALRKKQGLRFLLSESWSTKERT